MKYLGLAVVSLFWTAAVSAEPEPCDAAGSAPQIEKNFTVLLKVDDTANPPQLEIISDPQGCDIAKMGKGYIGFRERERGTIKLKIDGTSAVSCNQHSAGEALPDWVISKVELSVAGLPSTQKGKNFGALQSGWLYLDFPEANQYGVIEPKKKRTTLTLLNMNNYTGNERWVYYRVTVTNCADPSKELTSDPGWKNGGK